MKRLSCLSLLLAGLSSVPLAAASLYTATYLGTLGGYSIPTGINDSGQVIGRSQANSLYDHAFLYSNGVMQDLGTLGVGGAFSEAYGIIQQWTGDWDRWNGGRCPGHAFLYSNGVMQDLGTLGGLFSDARAINNSGQVVGISQIADGTYHGFLYSNGAMTDLGVSCQANGISDSGQIYGSGGPCDGSLMDLNSLIDPPLVGYYFVTWPDQ